MIKILIALMLLSQVLFAQCPVKGDGAKRLWHIDSAKNIQVPLDTSFASKETVQALMKDLLKVGEYAYVDCYLVSAKLSGPESCQCHDKTPSSLDYHIYVSNKPKALKKDCAIVEVSRYSRIFNAGLSLKYVKSLIGQKVRIYGYVFSDDEHKSAIGNWRSGLQELHPVFYIIKL